MYVLNIEHVTFRGDAALTDISGRLIPSGPESHLQQTLPSGRRCHGDDPLAFCCRSTTEDIRLCKSVRAVVELQQI